MGVQVYLYSFFNLDARWGWVINATPRPLYPQESLSTHCIGGWVDHREGLEKSRSHPEILGTRKVAWSTFHTEDPRILGTTVTWQPVSEHCYRTNQSHHSQTWFLCLNRQKISTSKYRSHVWHTLKRYTSYLHALRLKMCRGTNPLLPHAFTAQHSTAQHSSNSACVKLSDLKCNMSVTHMEQN